MDTQTSFNIVTDTAKYMVVSSFVKVDAIMYKILISILGTFTFIGYHCFVSIYLEKYSFFQVV